MWNGGQRSTLTEPGDPEICPVYDLHRLFSAEHVVSSVGVGCRNATVSCTECKSLSARSVSDYLEPLQARRSGYELNPNQVRDVLLDGAQKASGRAEETMTEVRKVMGVSRTFAATSLTAFENYAYDTAQPIRLSLEKFKKYWNSDSESINRVLVDHWKSRMVPSDSNLRESSEHQYITGRNKRVLVLAARQEPDGWHFRVPKKSFEVWSLLCWESSFVLDDFVIPQSFFAKAFSKLKKTTKENSIHVRIWKSAEKWKLSFVGEEPHQEIGMAIVTDARDPVDISPLASNYEPLR